MGSNDIVLRGVSLWPPGRGDGEIWGSNPSQNIILQIAAKPSVVSFRLVNTNEELGKLATAIPPFAKLHWSLFTLLRL